MEKYKDIDVPEFMKNKSKPILTQEEHQEEIEKAFIKGGLTSIALLFGIIILFIFLALIESL